MPASDSVLLSWTAVATSLGELAVIVDQHGALRRIVLPRSNGRVDETAIDDSGAVQDSVACGEVVAQLEEYFQGVRRQFDLDLEPGGTPFQRRVWDLMREIAWGTTTTYGQLAARLGDASLARAVGAAGAANPIPVVIPCHRVVGADGRLTGYAGGLKLKRALLAHEGVVAPAEAQGVLPFS